ncbi:hypothetical protein BIT28_12730 [Photobacterium proteolyticum]|uniref:DUF4062 domain-containing protein n=1 Tax=Photobacterium proteolyticum TaxID=1903952 RepID=A0A1Q9GK11_9GAMM|nr:DUF4062 domain-containing protein [Photobacterium proteolyticum]OLQ74825.1 hypothetical protein BIT28_12730 [Photobacterium proteolyticum]
MDNIFFSFSFSEFKPLVEHISKRMGESVTLQRCGLKPFHLAQLEAFKAAPLENSLQQVRNSRYMICLLGQNIGSEAESGKTYIELEIEAALEADVDVFAFLVGPEYDTLGNMPPAVRRVYERLSDCVTIGQLATNDSESVARQITNKLEDDVWQTLGEEEKLTLASDLLDVSGFPRHRLDRLPDSIRKQLTRIYRPGTPDNTSSPLAADLAQRKQWAYQSLTYGHQEQALKNLQKAIKEFGSDFFSCFWLSRLYALHGTREEHWRSSHQYAETLEKMLKDEDTLLTSLHLTHLGRAYCFQKDFAKAESLLLQAIESYPTYEALEFLAEVYLMQREQNNNIEWLHKAVDTMSSLLRFKLSHYVLVADRFTEKYPYTFTEVNTEVSHKLDSFYFNMHKSLSDNQQWAKQRLSLSAPQPPALLKDAALLQRAYVASQYVWQNYRLLRRASSQLTTRYINLQQQLDQLREQKKFQDQEHQLLSEALTEARDFLKARHERLEKVITAKEQEQAAHRKLQAGNIMGVIMFIAMGAGFNQSPNLGIPLLVGFILTLCIRAVFSKKKAKAVKSSEEEVNYVSEINRSLALSLSSFNNKIVQIELKTLLHPLLEEVEKLRESDITEAEHQLTTLYQNQSEQLNQTAATCQQELALLRHQTSTWLTKVNEFEQYSVSAHSGQYNHLMTRKGRIDVARKVELGSGSLESALFTAEESSLTGRALHLDGDRLKAWFDDSIVARSLIALTDNHTQAQPTTQQQTNHEYGQ